MLLFTVPDNINTNISNTNLSLFRKITECLMEFLRVGIGTEAGFFFFNLEKSDLFSMGD